MDTKAIKELIEIVEQSAITSFELEESGYRIRIGKSPSGAFAASQPFVQDTMFQQPMDRQDVRTDSSSTHRTAGPAAEIAAAEPVTPGDNVLSPMLGVFYSSPSPESEPFVKTGSKVKKGDVLCIIEAMKLMNEITAEKDGEITQVFAQNGQIVEFEQVIFKIL
ncbi:MAG: acetyl-CoA carboxylase biotin carboxyl carrier protein [Saccharofermentanales bacterium]